MTTNELKTKPAPNLEDRVSGESFTYRENLDYSKGEPVKKEDNEIVQDLFVYRVTESGVELYLIEFERYNGRAVISEHGMLMPKSTYYSLDSELETQFDGKTEKIYAKNNVFEDTDLFYQVLYDLARREGYAVMEAKTEREPGYLLASAIKEHRRDFVNSPPRYDWKSSTFNWKKPFMLKKLMK